MEEWYDSAEEEEDLFVPLCVNRSTAEWRGVESPP